MKQDLKETLESIKITIEESCIVDGEDVICTPEVMLWIENKIVDYGEEIKSEVKEIIDLGCLCNPEIRTQCCWKISKLHSKFVA